MAGMEQLEIQSKDYLVRWVTVKPNHTVSWSIQPHKKSIQFGIFKRPSSISGPTHGISSLPVSAPSTPSLPPSHGPGEEAGEKTGASVVMDKMTTIGMKPIHWIGKCEADKITSGKLDVHFDEAGTYALVFDNTFSKQMSKTATFVLVIYPTAHPPQLNTQAVNPQTASTSVPNGPGPAPKASPALRPLPSLDSLARTTSHKSVSGANGIDQSRRSSSSGLQSLVHTGVLSKRRRKRHQGYARRFFSLDYTSATLSYYRDRHSSALRGAVPLSLAAIGANTATREISIDSGAEIWHLKAGNDADFKSWTHALEQAAKTLHEPRMPFDLKVDTHGAGPQTSLAAEDREWAQIEALVGRIAGTRDAVRRLAKTTETGNLNLAAINDTESNASDVGLDEDQTPEERPAFWKRKPSANRHSSFFRRSVSAQGAVSVSPTEIGIRPSKSRTQLRPLAEKPGPHSDALGEGMHRHCKAMLHDLDTVVSDFSELLYMSKQRRMSIPKSAGSRLSIQTVDSQEFFDADDGETSAFLTIQEDSDGVDEEFGSSREDESGSSSEAEENGDYAYQKRLRSSSGSSEFPMKPKSLTPLPCKSVQRRSQIKPPAIMPPSLIGLLRKHVGKDLSSMSLPVAANEPTSLLQRAAEQLEYSSLLDKAASATDSLERLIYTTAFAVSSLSSSRVKERSIRKPFNPMLGETYELVREDKGFRFIAEKVSHRPVVQLAFQADSLEWSFTQAPRPSQKFWGKSSEIVTDGKVRLRLHSANECFSWSAATCFLRNIIAGEKYVEPVGVMTIVNETTGHRSVVTFKVKGMFSGRSEEVSVETFDAHGEKLPLGLHGNWTHSLHLTEHGTQTDKTIWSAGSLVDAAPKHYGMTKFAAALNEITDLEKDKLPPTDCRLRPDQRALEDGGHDAAEHLKNQLEENQRTRRKEMEEHGEKWVPRWFSPIETEGETVWVMKGGKDGYWDERSRGAWTGIVDVLKI